MVIGYLHILYRDKSAPTTYSFTEGRDAQCCKRAVYMSNATVPPAVRKGMYVDLSERVTEGRRKLRGEEIHYLLFGE